MRRGVLGMASLGALFASLGSAAMRAGEAIDQFADLAPSPPKKPKRKRGVARATIKRNQGSGDFYRRQIMRRRWLEGFSIPDDVREALEAAQAERERKNAKRAYMFRRQEEGKQLNEACRVYYAGVNEWDKANPNPTYDERMNAYDALGWPRIKSLLTLWDERMPLEIVFGAQAAT